MLQIIISSFIHLLYSKTNPTWHLHVSEIIGAEYTAMNKLNKSPCPHIHLCKEEGGMPEASSG